MTKAALITYNASLLNISEELLLLVLSYLDIPDLLSFSRTCRRARSLSIDPVLHAQRLHTAYYRLSSAIQHRPSICSLQPPVGNIYLSVTQVLARGLSRQLVALRLNRNLSHRPSASALVNSNILPVECCRKDADTGQVVWGGGVAPSIVSVKRKVERERLKDGLRAWLEKKALQVQQKQQRVGSSLNSKTTVRGLVKRFTSRKNMASYDQSDGYWDRNTKTGSFKKDKSEPRRGHVSGLRNFWESLASSQSVMT